MTPDGKFQKAALPDLVWFQEGPGLRNWQWVPAGIKVINGTNIREDGRFDPSNTDKMVSWDEFKSKYRHFGIEVGDIVVSSSGTIGKVAKINLEHLPMMMNTSVIRFRTINNNKLDSGYLYAWLRSRSFKDQAEAFAHGAAQRNFGPSHLKLMSIDVPPLEIQIRIARVLNAFDDLIDINNKRVSVLKEMSKSLFKEWFVNFDFHGDNDQIDFAGSQASLPRGWSRQRIGDVTAYVNRGIAPKYDDAAETLVVGQKCIRNGRLSLEPARRQSKKVPAEKVVLPGDILINSTGVGTLGRVAQAEAVPFGLTVDSHVTIVRPTEAIDRDYLGLQLLQMQAVFEHLGAGSTGQTELSRGSVQDQVITWPPADLRARFGQLVRPIRELIDQLMIQNHRLAASRDLLLPRLMSGQLSVSAAEQELEAA